MSLFLVDGYIACNCTLSSSKPLMPSRESESGNLLSAELAFTHPCAFITDETQDFDISFDNILHVRWQYNNIFMVHLWLYDGDGHGPHT